MSFAVDPCPTAHPPHTHPWTVSHLTMGEFLLCLASWGQYVLGMVVYANGWPRLSPRHFSSHEVRNMYWDGCMRHAWNHTLLSPPPPNPHHIRTRIYKHKYTHLSTHTHIHSRTHTQQLMHALVVSAAGTSAWLTYSLLDRFEVTNCLWAR